MINDNLAPVCLFVYNRPEHTEKTLEALSQNILANESVLYIFSDGPKNDCSSEDRNKIENVRNVIRKKSWCNAVIIEEAKTNKSLAESIIAGVTKVVQKHNKVIVLEDDLITSRYFLTYMNEALIKYENISQVKQISGFSFPVKEIEKENSSYFLPIINTWGWATWDRVWNLIDFKCIQYNPKTLNKSLFNFHNSYNYFKLLKMQMSNKVSSWGIRFYFNVFCKNGLVLFPDNSLVKNIGWDSTGRHRASYHLYSPAKWQNDYKINQFPIPRINENIMQLNIKYLKRENAILKKILKKFFAILKV